MTSHPNSGPAWCTDHQTTPDGQPRHVRVLLGQAERGDYPGPLAVWLSQTEDEDGGTSTGISFLQYGAEPPRTLTLERARELLDGLAVAVAALEAAQTETCTCGRAFEPRSWDDERDQVFCMDCAVERRRARLPRVVRGGRSEGVRR